MKISNGQRTKENWEAGKAWYSFILPAEKNIDKIDFIANIYPTVRKIYIICTFVIFTDFFFFRQVWLAANARLLMTFEVRFLRQWVCTRYGKCLPSVSRFSSPHHYYQCRCDVPRNLLEPFRYYNNILPDQVEETLQEINVIY